MRRPRAPAPRRSVGGRASRRRGRRSASGPPTRTPYQAAHLLQRAGVAAAPVQDASDLARDPQLRARGFIVEIDHPRPRSHRVPGRRRAHRATERWREGTGAPPRRAHPRGAGRVGRHRGPRGRRRWRSGERSGSRSNDAQVQCSCILRLSRTVQYRQLRLPSRGCRVRVPPKGEVGMSVRGRVRAVGADDRAVVPVAADWASGSVWRSAARRCWSRRPPVAATTARAAVRRRPPPAARPRRRRAAAPRPPPPAERPPRRRRRRPSTAASAASDGSTIKIGWLGPQSGALASTFAPALTGVQTYVKYWNDQGGVNGHKLDLSVYDTQSNSSAVLASARKAVGDGVQTRSSRTTSTSTPPRRTWPSRRSRCSASGSASGFYGPDKQTFFSPMGNWIAYQSNVGMKYLVDQGHTEDRRPVRPEPGQRQRRPRHRQRRADRRRRSSSTRTTAWTTRTPAPCWPSLRRPRTRVPRPCTPTSTARRRPSCRPT